MGGADSRTELTDGRVGRRAGGEDGDGWAGRDGQAGRTGRGFLALTLLYNVYAFWRFLGPSGGIPTTGGGGNVGAGVWGS